MKLFLADYSARQFLAMYSIITYLVMREFTTVPIHVSAIGQLRI